MNNKVNKPHSNPPQLISVNASLINSSKLIFDSSINDLAKRVEFHGGEFRVDDSIERKILVSIKL